MELLTKLILMLQRATLHNIKSYLICPLREKEVGWFLNVHVLQALDRLDGFMLK